MALHLVSSRFMSGTVERAIFDKLLACHRDLVVQVDPDVLFTLLEVVGDVVRDRTFEEDDGRLFSVSESAVESRVKAIRDAMSEELTRATDAMDHIKALLR